MRIIDENGYLFGRVNVIDALVVVVVVLALAGGVIFVDQSGASSVTRPTPTVAVTVQAVVPPYVADALAEASPGSADIHSVETQSSERIQLNGTDEYGSDVRYRLRMVVQVDAQERGDGLLYFRDERLYVGREVELDFGTTIVEGVVVEVKEAIDLSGLPADSKFVVNMTGVSGWNR